MKSRGELEKSKEKFDVIVGDLEQHIEEEATVMPCTQSFYEKTIKPRLNPMGIFVTMVIYVYNNLLGSLWKVLGTKKKY